MNRFIFLTVSLLSSGSAFAQTSYVAPSTISAQTEQTTRLEDIVVTASRREENLSRTALAIQAISASELTRSGVTKPEDLSAVAAGVSVSTGGNYPQTYIRGVGNYAASVYAENAIAYSIDGVYISRGWGVRGGIFDLSRVEVVKGPQGTLYGRNASGGAINLISARPVLGKTTGFVELETGNYDLIKATAAVGLPLGDTIALRASAQIVHRGGYLSDGYDDDKSESARLHLLWEPQPDLSLLVTGGYQHVGGMGAGSVLTPKLPGSPWRGASDPRVRAIFAAEPVIGPLLVSPSDDGYLNANIYSVSAEFNWNIGPATLTLLPAYRDSSLSDRTYVPGFQVDDNEHDKQTTFEARLSNQSDRLKWVLGAYYFDETQRNLDSRTLNFTAQGVATQNSPKFEANTRSYAAFGQATFSLTDRFRMTGGLRYTYERKSQNGLQQTYGFPPCAPGFVPDPDTPTPPLFCRIDIIQTGRLTLNAVTWKAGLEFDVSPESLAYADVSTGIKSGGFYFGAAPNTFRPEKVRAVDAGMKNRLFGNQLQLNLEAFYWSYRDHQESHVGPSSTLGVFTFITENAGKAESYGAEIDLIFVPTPNDRISANIQYNKTRYNSFLYQNITSVFGPPVTGCAVGPLSNGIQTVDCAGFQLARAPTWSGTVSYNHTFGLGNGGKLIAGVRSQFASSSYLSIDFLPQARQGTYALVDADLTYTTPDKKMSISAYVRNIADSAVRSQAFRSPFVSSANPLNPGGVVLSSIRPPRTYGVRLRFEL